MISHVYARHYCKNYEQIENYQEAINSSERWDCHHRNEIDMNLSKRELKEQGLYYNRPPEELVFLPYKVHTSLHHKGKITLCKGENHYLYKFICPIKLTYMYCKLKMSACRIAKEFGVDKNVIRRRLRELNIPIRKR